MQGKVFKNVYATLVLVMVALFASTMMFVEGPNENSDYTPKVRLMSQTTEGSSNQVLLSEMSEEECIEFIVENGVEIPQEFVDSIGLGSFVKWVIEAVESNPNYEFLYSYTVLHDFVESIRNLVASNGILKTTAQGQSIVATATYTLQDNTQYGSWNSNFSNYNCYTYSIGRSDVLVNPGYFSNKSFDINMSVYEMALLVKYDLEALGKGGVYISNVRPQIIGPNETLIAIRKSTDTGLWGTGLFAIKDYHFMKYHQNEGFWTHKPGKTAILKYNHQPADKAWKQEAITDSSGTVQSSNLVYDSEIYYIVYNWSGLAYLGTMVTGFTPQPGFNGNLDIPDGVTAIGAAALSNKSLSQITVPASVTTIGANAFLNTSNAKIYLSGRTKAPETFNANWNSAANPVYFNSILCVHLSKSAVDLNYYEHQIFCNDCRTFLSISSHNFYISGDSKICHDCNHSQPLVHSHVYNFKYEDFGNTHRLYCACGLFTEGGHVGNPVNPGDRFVICIKCNYRIDTTKYFISIMMRGVTIPDNEDCEDSHDEHDESVTPTVVGEMYIFIDKREFLLSD